MHVSVLVNAFKGTSSRLLRQERKDIAKHIRSGLWLPSYFAASTGGAPLEVIKRYVERQRASIIYIEALTRLLQGQDHNGYPTFVSDCCRD